MKHLTLGLAVFFIVAPSTFAEYRVYQYYVQPSSNYPTKAKSSVETSTLDPISYKAYHGGSSTKIDLLRTWMCPGYTGDARPPCEGPKENPLTEVAGGSNESR